MPSYSASSKQQIADFVMPTRAANSCCVRPWSSVVEMPIEDMTA